MRLWWVVCEAAGPCPAPWHVQGADEVVRHPLRPDEAGFGSGPRIQCPECGFGSPSPDDRAGGYCPNCHWWTSDSEMWRVKREEHGRRRELARRYFAEQTAPGLAADGMPQDGIDHLRRRYVRDTMGSPQALRELAQWEQQRG